MLSLASGHHVVVRRGQAEVVATRKEHSMQRGRVPTGMIIKVQQPSENRSFNLCKENNFASVSA